MTTTRGRKLQRRSSRTNEQLRWAWFGPALWLPEDRSVATRRRRRVRRGGGRLLTLLALSLLVLPALAGIALAGESGEPTPGVAGEQDEGEGEEQGPAEEPAKNDAGGTGEDPGSGEGSGGSSAGSGGTSDSSGSGSGSSGSGGAGEGTSGSGDSSGSGEEAGSGGSGAGSAEGDSGSGTVGGSGDDAGSEDDGDSSVTKLTEGDEEGSGDESGEAGDLSADSEESGDEALDEEGADDLESCLTVEAEEELACDPDDLEDLDLEALEQEVGAGVATLVSTGNAIASGNLSDDRVVQVIDVVVSDGAKVKVEQLVLVVNVGTAFAQSGGNAIAGFDAETWNDVVTLLSGGAVAIGNVTYTDVNQYLAALGKDDMHIQASQTGVVVSAGYAQANSGGNAAVAHAGSGSAGTVAATTGAAYALGNLAEVFVTQDALAMASGNAVVMTDQSAVVVNQGVAVANSGGNLVVAGGSAGSGYVTTGPAVAEGNVSTTDVKQKAVAVATGDVTIEIRQGTIVLNIGVALANSGANSIGTGASGSFEGPDGGFEHAVLSIEIGSLDDLEAFGDYLAYWLSQLLGDPLALGSFHHEEHRTEWYDELSGSSVTLVQRALVFNLGFAQVVVGDNVTVHPNTSAGGESDALGAFREAALGSMAEVVTGNASAVGNLSVSIICQRMAIGMELEAPECFPEIEVEPEPEPEPETETPAPEPSGSSGNEPEEPAAAAAAEPTTVEVGGVLLVSEQWWTTWWPATWWTTVDNPGSTLPRTGLDTQGLTLGAGLLLLLGTAALFATRRSPRRVMRREGR